MVNAISLLQNELIKFMLSLVAIIIFAYISKFVLAKVVRKLADSTKTDLDDIILSHIEKPVYIFVIIGGIYFSIKFLSVISQYNVWIDRIFFIAEIIVASVIITKIITIIVNRWLKVQKKFEKTPRLINKIVTLVIYIIAVLMILEYLSIEITPLVATLGLGGLAVGLALQSTLTNLFGGIYLISDRPVNVGNYVELNSEVSGFVDDIGWRSTRIKTLANTIIIVPNSKLSESTIKNYSLPEQEMAVIVQCGVSYNSDLKKVEKVTIEVAEEIQKKIPGAVKSFKPFIRYHTFADSNINFSIIMKVEKFVDKYLITHELIKALKSRYDKEKIEISWPVRKIYNAN